MFTFCAKKIMGYIRYPPIITLEKPCKVFTNLWNLFSEFYNQRNPLIVLWFVENGDFIDVALDFKSQS